MHIFVYLRVYLVFSLFFSLLMYFLVCFVFSPLLFSMLICFFLFDLATGLDPRLNSLQAAFDATAARLNATLRLLQVDRRTSTHSLTLRLLQV